MKLNLLKKLNEKLDYYCENRLIRRFYSEGLHSISGDLFFIAKPELEVLEKSQIQVKSVIGELNESNINSATKLRTIRRLLDLPPNPSKRKKVSKCSKA